LISVPGEPTSRIYITGGFAKNPYFTGFLSCAFPGRKIFTSQVDNATALGAAMVIAGKVWDKPMQPPDLGLKEVSG
jgi:sugar (pentulose or hexulose) kinase